MHDIIFVDENDNEIGSGSFEERARKKLIARVSAVAILNKKGEILLQKRSDTIKFRAGYWDVSAAGHIDVGETYEQGAARELAEEMGIKLEESELTLLDKMYLDSIIDRKRFASFYVGRYDGEVKIDQDEVSDYQWIDLKQLQQQIQQGEFDGDYTPTLESAIGLLFKQNVL